MYHLFRRSNGQIHWEDIRTWNDERHRVHLNRLAANRDLQGCEATEVQNEPGIITNPPLGRFHRWSQIMAREEVSPGMDGILSE